MDLISGGLLLAGLVILCTYCTEGITGFGGTILALPFITIFIDLKTTVLIMPVLNLIIATYIIIRSWQSIRWDQLKFILLHVALGIPCGIWLFDYLPGNIMLKALAVLMIAVGGCGYLNMHRSRNVQKETAVPDMEKKQKLTGRLVLFCGGIVQGAFSSGGPLVVIYAKNAFSDKTVFRVTLSMLWMVSNIYLLTLKRVLFPDTWVPGVWKTVLVLLPFLFCGIATGDCLHRKVNGNTFKLLVNILLVIMGVIMLFR